MPEEYRNKAVVVGTSSIEVSRKLLNGMVVSRVYTNASTAGQIISLAWGDTAAANSGMVLYPAGTWSETIDAAFVPSAEVVNAVSSAAGGILAISERLR